jgi:hypothetical protein
MTLLNMTPLAFLAGGAALAGMLYAFHLLRVRYRVHTVVTTMFWKEAVTDARARVRVRRFRHPWTYVLLLGILVLMWLAMAQPHVQGTDLEQVVAVIDGSSSMDAAGSFDDVAARVGEWATAQTRSVQVVWAGASARTLLINGEDPALLTSRLAEMSAELCPSTVTAIVETLAAQESGRPLRIVVFSSNPLPAQFVALLPERVTVEYSMVDPDARPNRAITALGLAPGQSGTWDRVDAVVEWRMRNTEDRGAVHVQLDGQALTAPTTTRTALDGTMVTRIHDLPARGQLLEVALDPPDGYAGDDRAALRLPLQPPVRISIRPELATALHTLVALDSGIEVVEQQPHVAVVGPNDPNPPSAALRVSEPGSAAVVVTCVEADDPAAIRERLLRFGVEQVDALESGPAVRCIVKRGPSRVVEISSELLGRDYDFLQSKAFPLTVGWALRWLGQQPEPLEYAAVGEPLSSSIEACRTPSGREVDAVGVPFVPARSGDYLGDAGHPITVSAFNTATTAEVLDDAMMIAPATTGRTDAVTVLLLIALGLAGVEWHLYRRGQIP